MLVAGRGKAPGILTTSGAFLFEILTIVSCVILEAKNLSPDQKVVIEGLLGRSILQTETISVRAIETPGMSEASRHELADELRRYLAEMDARRPVFQDDEEEILDEAMRSVRPGYRPHK